MDAWKANLRVVLVESRNSLNIGAAARAMYNFGFADLWCVRPYEPSFRSARSSAGAAAVMQRARVTDDLAEAVSEAELVVACSGLESRRQRHVQRRLPAGGDAIRTHIEDRRAALVFGSEKFGLSNDDLSHCDWVLSVPTDEGCPSMNLGQAVAVCCYAIARNAVPQESLQTPATVPAGVRERILSLLMPILQESGFLHDEGIEERTRKLRRFVSRLRLAPEDGRMLLAILRQIDWKLAHPGSPASEAESSAGPASQAPALQQVVGKGR
ncbi:MAG: RNA methyltransferase [Bryobacterales bacterium]|nr:RNA methyltransferase [Bryobacterales bacterium]MDE0264954.1 RNA methyltransferase [Bryobacterales bacterium]